MLQRDFNCFFDELQSLAIHKKLSLLVVFLLALLSVSGCASIVRPNYSQTFAELRAGDYQLDKEHAYVNFKIEHLGLSTVVGRFNAADASLDFDPARIADLRLEGIIQAGSIDMNNTDLDNRLRGADWLDTQRFPTATFTTVLVTPIDENRFSVTGDFTLKGIKKPLVLEATFKGGADNLLTGKYTLGFSAIGSFLRSDYGIDGFAALVADEVFIEIHAEFQKIDQ